MVSGLGWWVHLSMSKKQQESMRSMVQNTWVRIINCQKGHCPELDVSLALGPDVASYYQPLRRVMRWVIEIGWILIPRYPYFHHTAMPRQWHLLEAALHLMGYLKLRYNCSLLFDHSYPDIDHSNFLGCNLTDFSRCSESFFHSMHHHQERKRLITMLTDSNHGGDK